MHSIRPPIALDPRTFGRRQMASAAVPCPAPETSLSDDLRLFGSTFAAGFLFVFLIIA